MSLATFAPPHPVVACVEQVREALAAVGNVQPVFMSVADKERVLADLARAEAQLAELKARVLAASDDVAVEHGARDVAAWLAQATQADPRGVRADLHLAQALERRPVVAAGMRAGAVSAAQARVITQAIEELPAELGGGAGGAGGGDLGGVRRRASAA